MTALYASVKLWACVCKCVTRFVVMCTDLCKFINISLLSSISKAKTKKKDITGKL